MDIDVLCSTPAGVLHRHDAFYYQAGWGSIKRAEATNVSADGTLIYARDGGGFAKTVRVSQITRILKEVKK